MKGYTINTNVTTDVGHIQNTTFCFINSMIYYPNSDLVKVNIACYMDKQAYLDGKSQCSVSDIKNITTLLVTLAEALSGSIVILCNLKLLTILEDLYGGATNITEEDFDFI